MNNLPTELVLSVFPGVDLLGRAFTATGQFAVVTGPDPVVGGCVTELKAAVNIRGRFDGLIGGPPCQGFSCANIQRTNAKHPSVIHSRKMLREYVRLVEQFGPEWFVCENVPGVPDIRVKGYRVQRIAISDEECGGSQVRFRHVQFGSRKGDIIRPERVNDRGRNGKNSRRGRKAYAITTKQNSKHLRFADHCRKQGLPGSLKLPGWTKDAKFKAVGNGVPLSIGTALAWAVICRSQPTDSDCPCGCGRVLTGNQTSALDSCRKRLQLDRQRVRCFIDRSGYYAET